MAVPVRGAEIVFEALFRSLAGLDYEYIEANMTKHLHDAMARDLHDKFDL
jgi:hypothetical protein